MSPLQDSACLECLQFPRARFSTNTLPALPKINRLIACRNVLQQIDYKKIEFPFDSTHDTCNHILQTTNWIESLVVQENHSFGQRCKKNHKQVLCSILLVDFKEKNPYLCLLFKIKTLFLLGQVGLLIFMTSALLEFQLSSLLKLRHPCCLCNIEVNDN
jgi:hypothetical protein